MTKIINSVIITPLKTQCDEHSAVGVFSDEGPPVPIPNTAVKLISADNTWLEAAREDKAMPTQTKTKPQIICGFLFYFFRNCQIYY